MDKHGAVTFGTLEQAEAYFHALPEDYAGRMYKSESYKWVVSFRQVTGMCKTNTNNHFSPTPKKSILRRMDSAMTTQNQCVECGSPATHKRPYRDECPTDRGAEVREGSEWVCDECDLGAGPTFGY